MVDLLVSAPSRKECRGAKELKPLEPMTYSRLEVRAIKSVLWVIRPVFCPKYFAFCILHLVLTLGRGSSI